MTNSPPARRHLRYQPGLDGLRAFAVLAVMLYHFGVRRFRGGLLGVDVFFVLSGFLITTLLLREHDGSGRISFGDFYVRRLRRLFPALVLLLMAVLIHEHLAHTPPYISEAVRKDTLASLFYVANWRFTYSKLSYFAQFSAPLPLRHVWSLAVEEQWYLVWPVALVLVLRATRRNMAAVLGVIVALALASAAWMDHVVKPLTDPSRAYYGTDTRAHTLLVGAGLAVVLHRWPVRRTGVARGLQVSGAVALAICTAVVMTVDGWDYDLYRGGFLLFAVGAALVVAGVMADEHGALARVLGVGPLPWIGRISYGLYLWHWPVAVWINPESSHLDGWALFAARTGVSFAAATASYYLVERPIRTAAWHRLRLPRLTTAASTAAVSLALVAFIAVPVTSPAAARPQAHVGSGSAPVPDRPGDLKVVLAGDSVSWSLGYRLPKQPGLRVADAAALGCGVLPGHLMRNGVLQEQTGVPPCETERKRWAKAIDTLHPDVVVFAFGAWEVYDHVLDGELYSVFSDGYRDALAEKLDDDVDFVRTHTDAPIVFLAAPCMNQKELDLGEQTDPRESDARRERINGILEDVVRGRSDAVGVLDWGTYLCPGGDFHEEIDGVVMRPDGVHFDATSAPVVWRWLLPQLRAEARRLGTAAP